METKDLTVFLVEDAEIFCFDAMLYNISQILTGHSYNKSSHDLFTSHSLVVNFAEKTLSRTNISSLTKALLLLLLFLFVFKTNQVDNNGLVPYEVEYICTLPLTYRLWNRVKLQ